MGVKHPLKKFTSGRDDKLTRGLRPPMAQPAKSSS